ncbi:MAG: type II toxin-antitoxin system RelE/ParE family toxin [Phycisphaerae bacterium]|nr:type II toxin-antitoxin system RelE/ParE family toxin [Saprospiraceae bacterium]
MDRQVKWTQRVQTQIDTTFDYIAGNLSVQGAINFIQKVYEQENRLSKHPESGKFSAKSRNIRYILLGRHRRLYYRFSDRLVTVLALFDTRQDPRKQPF